MPLLPINQSQKICQIEAWMILDTVEEEIPPQMIGMFTIVHL
jgi:hypothetical protein